MTAIATLTMNPTIDISYEVDRVFHTHKMRASNERYAPGGGGINVARVFVRLGGEARCHYLAGGATGAALDGLLDRHDLVRRPIAIAGDTRVATTVLERSSGKEFRFTPAGPTVAADEWQQALAVAETAECDWFVASGSLPQGVPADFYARVSAILARRGIPFALDTSGEALKAGLAGGGVALVKPSQGELQHFAGQPLGSVEAIAQAARAIVAAGQARMVAVTMGHEGAVLAHGDETLFLPALAIEAQSAVGAGDSFLAAMVHALAGGRDVREAFRFAIAAGAAAILSPGTGLAHKADIERLFAQVAPA